MLGWNKELAVDLTVTTLLFIVACLIGKTVMENSSSGGWFSFNIPAIGIFIAGELVWLWKRKI